MLTVFSTLTFMIASSSPKDKKLASFKDQTDCFGVSKFLARCSRKTEVFSPLGALEMYYMNTLLNEEEGSRIRETHKEIIGKEKVLYY